MMVLIHLETKAKMNNKARKHTYLHIISMRSLLCMKRRNTETLFNTHLMGKLQIHWYTLLLVVSSLSIPKFQNTNLTLTELYLKHVESLSFGKHKLEIN